MPTNAIQPLTPPAALAKTEACSALDCSSRTLNRYIADGKLSAYTVRGPSGQTELRVPLADIERLKAEFEQPSGLRAVPSPDEQALAKAVPALPALRSVGDSLGGALEKIAAALTAKAEPKPWLTLDEAISFSGLTRAWLLAQAEACVDAADAENGAIRDMGQRTRGGRWRFNREWLTK